MRWHQIGQVQTNKAKQVARYAECVHSVDRSSLVRALNTAVTSESDAPERAALSCLIQISLDGDPQRGGVPIEQLDSLAEEIQAAPGLELDGIMAVAPIGVEPLRAFEPLLGLSERVQSVRPEAKIISAGMSGDARYAIACGATHLRIGSAVLGTR